MTRASLGVALLAKNAAETLPRCLKTIVPYAQQVVVCVDETTTDKTARLARKAGAEVHPIQVSDWHECSKHGRVRAQHFARARNESFTHLDPTLEWWMWLDSDDVFEGGELLAEVLAKTPPQFIGLWLEYHYSTMNNRAQTNTLFHRERLLRREVGWEWEYRVHEVVKPKRDGPWLGHPNLRVYHQEGAHKSENSAARNLLLLEIDLEENPQDGRAMFYVGNQYFALNEWAKAVEWYERSFAVDTNPYQRWQSAVYQSMAYERLGMLTEAGQSAHFAMDEIPYHPEPYYRLASLSLLGGEFEKAEFWVRLGDERKDAPFFCFKNPLDRSYNSKMVLADAIAQQGRAKEAREVLETAYQVVQDQRVAGAVRHYHAMETAARQADAFAGMVSLLGKDWAASMGPTLPETVRAFGRVRDLYVPVLLARRPRSQPSITFHCGRSLEEWSPASLNTTGIGGSETAVVKIAEQFAADGWSVEVYNGAGRYEGEYDGVGYWGPERLGTCRTPTPDVLVSWRNPALDWRAKDVPRQVLWCHDLNYGPDARAAMGRWDVVLGVSAWHAGMLRQYYDLPERQVSHVPNGIDLSRFAETEKVPFQCVYTSSADRGLPRLLKLWPKIVAHEPGAKLIVAYGWNTIDRMIAQGRGDLADFKASVERQLAATPNVEYVGRLAQDKLAELYCCSSLWLYPASFLEVSCISAMEAMAGACVPVCSAAGALRETVGDGGILVEGYPLSRPWPDFYLHVALGALTNPVVRAETGSRGLHRAQAYSWERSYREHWKPVLASLLEGLGKERAA